MIDEIRNKVKKGNKKISKETSHSLRKHRPAKVQKEERRTGKCKINQPNAKLNAIEEQINTSEGREGRNGTQCTRIERTGECRRVHCEVGEMSRTEGVMHR